MNAFFLGKNSFCSRRRRKEVWSPSCSSMLEMQPSSASSSPILLSFTSMRTERKKQRKRRGTSSPRPLNIWQESSRTALSSPSRRSSCFPSSSSFHTESQEGGKRRKGEELFLVCLSLPVRTAFGEGAPEVPRAFYVWNGLLLPPTFPSLLSLCPTFSDKEERNRSRLRGRRRRKQERIEEKDIIGLREKRRRRRTESSSVLLHVRYTVLPFSALVCFLLLLLLHFSLEFLSVSSSLPSLKASFLLCFCSCLLRERKEGLLLLLLSLSFTPAFSPSLRSSLLSVLFRFLANRKAFPFFFFFFSFSVFLLSSEEAQKRSFPFCFLAFSLSVSLGYSRHSLAKERRRRRKGSICSLFTLESGE